MLRLLILLIAVAVVVAMVMIALRRPRVQRRPEPPPLSTPADDPRAEWARWERYYLDLAASAQRSGDHETAERNRALARTYRALLDGDDPPTV